MPHRAFDAVTVRCPDLGGAVSFAYCRELREGLPCGKALVCFERQFPVVEYFRLVLREETFRRCFVTPKPNRYEQLLGAVAAAAHSNDTSSA